MDLTGKTVIVTGAASGIGAATLSAVRAAGATVIAVDRHHVEGADHVHQVDLLDPRQIDALAEQLPAGAHGLCNVAGVAPTASPAEVLTVNFLALRRLTERLAPTLADGASIVNVASMAGNGWRDHLDQVQELLSIDWPDVDAFAARHRLDEGARSYFLSKEAVIVWTMQQRWRWRDRGIRMNCVSPGPIETPILGDFLETLGERAQESVRNMDRFGRPDDVAPAIVWLLGDEAAWFRGANLTPDGGMGAHLALKRFGLV